jgi:hypothetical protein
LLPTNLADAGWNILDQSNQFFSPTVVYSYLFFYDLSSTKVAIVIYSNHLLFLYSSVHFTKNAPYSALVQLNRLKRLEFVDYACENN